MKKLGDWVHYKMGSLEGHDVILGKSTMEFPILGAFYILEDLSGNIPNEAYPYTHFTCPEVWLTDIEDSKNE